ncbi:MAG: MBL fold metallo-hydrolase [Dehalococcoidia bacterium]|nr:MAG: MBL fold metallo-hydrolase [Dehalococcoidia bacterium]
MVEINEVADQVYRLEVLIPAMDSIFGAYLIRGEEGIVIEPGPAIAVPAIKDALKRLGIKELAYIIPTHLHIDHAGGIGTLGGLYPHAEVLVHPAGAKHVIDPSRLIDGTRQVWGDDFDVGFGPILPVKESQVRIAGDGEIILVNDRELEILHAPGHAPHQLVVFDRKVRGIFCGDALGILPPIATPFPLPNTAPPGYDQELYLATIERLRRSRADILFYSHGGVERDVDRLISMAADNTRAFSDIALESLREGATRDDVMRRVRDYISHRFGLEVEEKDLDMTVDGYIYYFEKKGLE